MHPLSSPFRKGPNLISIPLPQFPERPSTSHPRTTSAVPTQSYKATISPLKFDKEDSSFN